jgi:hemerythrin-like domain-containing protein
MNKKQNEITPLKRHEALVSYSREHHNGLLLVWKLRTGQKKGVAPDRMAAYIGFAYEGELKNHFQDEESFLAPMLSNGHPLLLRLLEEHVLLRELVEKINLEPNNQGLQTSFADALERHIRFEERELFPFLQEHLHEAQLKELATMERNAPLCNLDDWKDVFWLQ